MSGEQVSPATEAVKSVVSLVFIFMVLFIMAAVAVVVTPIGNNVILAAVVGMIVGWFAAYLIMFATQLGVNALGEMVAHRLLLGALCVVAASVVAFFNLSPASQQPRPHGGMYRWIPPQHRQQSPVPGQPRASGAVLAPYRSPYLRFFQSMPTKPAHRNKRGRR